MSIDLSIRTRRALEEVNISPNIVVKFEGIETLFSAKPVKEFIKINDPGFFIGAEGYFIGGLFTIEADKNKTLIDSGTTTFTIQQQMNQDEGESSSISSMNIGLVDKDQFISLLITPGEFVPDVLGIKAQIFVTFGSVSFFEDSLEIFKGIVSTIDSRAGIVKFKINHPETKKKVEVFKIVETRLTANVNSSQTTMAVEDASTFILPTGPLLAYIRINNEIIRYTGRTGNTLTGLTRGVLDSTAISHTLGNQVRTLYSLEGNPIDLALQLMMSGFDALPVYENIPVTHFRQIGASVTQISRAIYFENINLVRDFGISIGDTITTTGANNGSNNVTRTITDVQRTNSGFYVLVSGSALVLEQDSNAVMKIFSQYNTLPVGLRMKPDEVDIEQHIRIRDFFHSATQMRIYLKEDEIEGKEFIEEQLFKPIACYTLPRKAKSSIGYTVGPIPGDEITSFDITNVVDPRNVTITRTSARAFFNEVVYKYDDSPLVEEEKFTSGQIFISQTSKNRITGINRAFVVESLGLRSELNAVNIISSNANRILDRYKFAAEIVTLKTLLKDSVRVEIGDIVIGDFKALKVTDISRGDRQFSPRLFEVQNKSINLKTGDVEFSLLDTSLNINTRFCLMSPGSTINSVISQTQFVIAKNPLYPSKFGINEFRKWENIINPANPISAVIRNSSFSLIDDVVITSISDNTFTLRAPASFTITSGMVVEFSNYEDNDTSDKQKLVYGYMTDNATFVDGKQYYSMI